MKMRKRPSVLLAICLFAILMLTGCSAKNEDVKPNNEIKVEQEILENITDEQALGAIQKYCYSNNPDLKSIVDEGKYPVYWDIFSSDEKEIVILFRSYTGAQNRYYINRDTGDTVVTEFVPGITDEEEQTGESFNIHSFK